MNPFAIFTYAAIVGKLQAGDSVLSWFLSCDEWTQLEAYLPLRFKGDYVALETPRVEAVSYGENRTINSEADDRYFEETRQALYDSRRLQR